MSEGDTERGGHATLDGEARSHTQAESADDCKALDALPEEEARAALQRCCGSSRWVAHMLSERPFGNRSKLLEAASRHWNALTVADWDEAFSHHPRIGEPGRVAAGAASAASTAGWASKEQAGAARADDAVKAAIAEGNRTYEAKFGRIYLVCATGKSGEELLGILRARLDNEPDVELRIAAAEQDKITRLRLEKLLSS
ncbi:2-oxo-4-hydroxy-4-carboxy-5-ureidoimidazoline decarboxylase [Chondromyces crocatus]|uniref:2-oxo-4-hydroxy-4-carboxy-5-ureidoimidazoline decarboxylase n=1 Tax=Chondromyces crocatus TaxID=52 RepID=A0A0K1EQJ0_CHOCO|nr:2-oxo-4-hydroxy-4-carboxy-5-ureidoimidazoline decarboxylase [Chondromyces crocatus]AKT42893.1 OHCU decarboxylase [Chondromyces crocatus]